MLSPAEHCCFIEHTNHSSGPTRLDFPERGGTDAPLRWAAPIRLGSVALGRITGCLRPLAQRPRPAGRMKSRHIFFALLAWMIATLLTACSQTGEGEEGEKP